INNIVDVTNYVMLEMNHPLHAFDYKKLKGSVINIRPAKKGEKILALDAKTYELDDRDIVIADGNDPVALAGIMGGENYSVDASTTTVVLESAFFNPGTVRKTSRRLGVSSDSSYRFERGIDIGTVTDALNRAASLIIQASGGKASNNIIDLYPAQITPKIIEVRFDRVNNVLGTSFDGQYIKTLIDKLYFPVQDVRSDRVKVVIPSYRVDMSEEIDIIEDIAQIYGYDNIAVTLPEASVTIGRENGLTLFNRSLASVMAGLGFCEAYNYSFANNKLVKDLKARTFVPENSVALKNPFNDEETHLKTTLIPDLIKNLVFNYNNENENIHLFEAANVFAKSASGYLQFPRFGAITYGHIIDTAFNKTGLKSDLYYLKSAVAAIYRLLNTDKPLSYCPPAGAVDFYEYCSDIKIGSALIGKIGQVKQEILYDNRFKEKAYIFELYTDVLYTLYMPRMEYSHLSRFPVVKRDLSILVGMDIPEASIESVIMSDYRPLIRELKLYDLYRGEQIPEGSKSLTYSIVFQSDKKTLGDNDINRVMERIISKLKAEVRAELRS
ncbi:MAG: phenylalanine--tRNA ligase subunit beta, partial [Spirochaetia bacterium]|nr:phenylalanine--tRNA ligase subunit beta [Spirochaetia bacterium]